MNIPPLEYFAPRSTIEALSLKAQWGARAAWLAGGTDLLPRAKQGVAVPEAVISLKHLGPELAGVQPVAGGLRLGAQTTLRTAAAHAQVASRLPGLSEALASIGAETLQQRVGTLGGNLCAQTRCLYYNQSVFWRSALAPCFKLGGEVCHPGGSTADRCRSVCQSDGAVMLTALGARVELASTEGRRELTLDQFFTGKGEEPLDLRPNELVTAVLLESATDPAGSAYEKMAARGSLDFPQISAGATMLLKDGKVGRVGLALGSVFAAPLALRAAMQPLLGAEPSDQALREAASRAGGDVQPFLIENQSAPAAWRAQMAPVVVLRALTRARNRALEMRS